MRMRRISLTALAASLALYGCGQDKTNPTASDGAVTNGRGQTRATRPASGTESGDRTSKLVEQLSLTEEQQQTLKDLRAAQKAEIETIRNSGAERSDLRKQMKAAHQKFQDALMALLTNEQKAKYEGLKAAIKK